MDEQAGDVDLSNWIGRTTNATDYLSASPAQRLAATFDKEPGLIGDGTHLPALAHWLYFLPMERQSTLGPDGHPRRGGFLPPVHHLPRRMWAGGRLQFLSPLRVGTNVERLSTIKSVTEKTGKSGALVFVTVEHRVSERGGEVAVIEEHDIVYREARPADPAAAYPRVPDLSPAWSREIVPDEVMLFRYSALTFNGHRIHYDQPYVVNEESYPGLIVHGPMMAAFLTDLLEVNLAKPLRRFAFRSMSPMFAGGRLTVNATAPDSEGRSDLWIATQGDRLVMEAQAWL